jgi:pimeloyl-ACP methyl ester carboxylesterase
LSTVIDVQPQETTISLYGCDAYLLRSGSGEPVVYLHGDRGGSEWTTALAGLARDHDVIAPDLPGMGFSSFPEWLDNIHDLAYFNLGLLKPMPGKSGAITS